MKVNSFWKKHAADPDWVSRYIEIDSLAQIQLFTQTNLNGSVPTVAFVSGVLNITNAAAIDAGVQFVWPVGSVQALAPTAPSEPNNSSYQREMEFIITCSLGNLALTNFFAGFYPDTDVTIQQGHLDSLGIKAPTGGSLMALDFFTNGANGAASSPSGGPAIAGFKGFDTAVHEWTIQLIPLNSYNGMFGQVKVFMDGEMVLDSGIDTNQWLAMTTALLAPGFGFSNTSAALTAAQRTMTLTRIGWAYKK